MKFYRLIKQGKLNEAYQAAKADLIDDAGDIAVSPKLDEYFQQIADAAVEEGLTDLQHLQKEVALAVVAEAIELYNRPDHGTQFATRTREPFEFGLIIDDQYAGFLRTRITEGTGLHGDEPELALNGLDRFLAGDEPSADEYRALEAAFRREFVTKISKAAQSGLLRHNETGERPLAAP